MRARTRVSAFSRAHRGDLAELFQAGGLHEIEESGLSVDVAHPAFEEWWEPFLLGVVVSARAWAARGLVS